MCRIAGFWDFTYKHDYDLSAVMTAMRDSLAHGGPDDAGLYCRGDMAFALGHRRLSILDLSPLGHQPMANDSGSVWITYNGEVYNFKEIRADLERKNYTFKSNSDTEVILKAYDAWGLDAVRKFRGMFAFALWDDNRQQLILCRDRAGVKPLYWHYSDGLLLFASELKAFHEHPRFRKALDAKALAAYLRYGYIPAPYSIFQNTCKLEPGHFLIIDKNRNIRKDKYWDIEDYYLKGGEGGNAGPADQRSEEEIMGEVERLLRDSFNLRMVSDVPVGVFLSGGIDSSAVCALLAQEGHRLKTFTIGFHEKAYDEAIHAKKIATLLGTDHTELYCTAQDALAVLPKLPLLFDEPFGDPSGIPTHLVSMLARKQVKVSLSADGGDELFCGYTRYEMIGDRLRKFDRLPMSSLIARLVDAVSPETAQAIYHRLKFFLPRYTNVRERYGKLKNVLPAGTAASRHRLASSYFLSEDLKALGFDEEYPTGVANEKLNDFHQMMLLDFKTFLPDDVLVKTDRATMGVALEGREPLLDNTLIEYVAGLPLAYKYRNGVTKYLLRKILYQYVPRELMDRPKQGFGVPVYEWFKDELRGLYPSYLNKDRIKKGGLFNPDAVDRLLRDFMNAKGVMPQKLWFLLMFELWREKWL